MQLSPEEIGKKLRELQPAYAGVKLGDLQLGNAYLKRFGPVEMPDNQGQAAQSAPGQQVAPVANQSGGPVNDLAQNLIQKYFPKDQWQNAIKIAQAESGLNPAAVGDNYPIRGQTIPSYGLFQIRALPGRPAPNQLLNPEANVAYAAELYKSQGWRPWSTAKKLGLK